MSAGTQYIYKQVVEAKTRVSLDFTDEKNKDAKDTFETSFVALANADAGTFEYALQTLPARRQLEQGTDVTVLLEYANETAAKAGETVVSAPDFVNSIQKDLADAGVVMTLTNVSATVKEVVEEVTEHPGESLAHSIMALDHGV